MNIYKYKRRGLFAITLLAVLLFFAYILVQKIRSDDFYNIEKNSLTWMIVMNNKIVSDYPIIKNDGEVGYNWKGFNHTSNSIIEWNIEYVSTELPSKILAENIEYFRKNNYKIKKSYGIKCSWELFDNTIYYNITNSNNKDCITLALTTEKNNKTRVRFYFIRGKQ